MLVHLDYDPKLPQVHLKINLSETQSLKNYKCLLMSVRAYALLFDLDPELDLDDLEEIAEKTAELGKDSFTFVIGPEEIEVDI
jgi:hypothetical protein